jgi:hypothetical protein
MKIAAFNEDGTCGCMADNVLDLIDTLVDQGATLSEYTFYKIDDSNPFELSIDHKKPTKS